MFIECGLGNYSESGYEPCQFCEMSTYQDSYGQTTCNPCPDGGKTEFEGANSSEQCRIFHGDFEINRPDRNLNGLNNTGLYVAPASRLHFNGTLTGWNVELIGDGNVNLFIFREYLPYLILM